MDNKEKHAALAELLIEREVIFTEDVERIFGPSSVEESRRRSLGRGAASQAKDRPSAHR